MKVLTVNRTTKTINNWFTKRSKCSIIEHFSQTKSLNKLIF